MEEIYHFLDKHKSEIIIKDKMASYLPLIKKLLKENNEDLNIENLLNNCLIYLENEINKLNKDYQLVTVSEKYSEYITFMFLKNKNILKKKFKNVLMDLNIQLKNRNGGDLINIQFKDVNLLIYIHKNLEND